jgi:hypothetical protein
MILEENLMMGPFHYCFKSAIYLDRKPIHLQSIYQLLIEQTNCTGIAYFWEQDKTNSHFIADYKGG